jgi:phage-related minor tail protein
MTKLGTDALPILNDLLPVFTNLTKLASGSMGGFADDADNAFQSLADVAAVLKFVTDVGVGVDEFLKRNGENWGAFGAVVQGVIDSVVGALNPFLSLLNRIADLIRFISNTPKSITGAGIGQFAGGVSANMPRPMAEGGIVMRPSSNLLVGEAGPEAIIPLDRLGKMGYGGGSTYNISVSAMNADARVGELIVSAIKKYERTSGSVFVSA